MADQCGTCNGSGTIIENYPDGDRDRITCPDCNGSGKK